MRLLGWLAQAQRSAVDVRVPVPVTLQEDVNACAMALKDAGFWLAPHTLFLARRGAEVS